MPRSNNHSILVSVVIPALNEERAIGQCLESLSRLEFSKDSLEVILVDNGSTDRTVEIAQSFSSALPLTVLKGSGRISALRNLGASRSRGEILAFLDADCVVPTHWLKNAVTMLARDGIGVLGAHYRIPEQSSWVARAWFGGVDREKQGNIAWVPSGDMFLKRSTFERIGRFDESLQTNEDCELCERARALGLRVVGDASIAVEHLGTPQTLGQFYRKNRWHATDGLRVFLRSLPKITNPRPLLLAVHTLVSLAGIVIGLEEFFRIGNVRILAVFLAALVAPAVILSLRLVVRRKQWGNLVPLAVLHVAFGLARGHALLAAAVRGPKGMTELPHFVIPAQAGRLWRASPPAGVTNKKWSLGKFL